MVEKNRLSIKTKTAGRKDPISRIPVYDCISFLTTGRFDIHITPTLQKSRMPQIIGVQGCSCSVLPQILGNEGYAVYSAFPQSKNYGCLLYHFGMFFMQLMNWNIVKEKLFDLTTCL